MRTQILRINYNHLKPYFEQNYLHYRQAFDRCIVGVLSTIDKLVQPLDNLWFEDQSLQALWLLARQQPHHEAMVQTLAISEYRQMLEEMHEQLEVFLRHKYCAKSPAAYVHINLDATCHLCVQMRTF